jgi:anti-sigma regulatory factor (Ser/Thr protein kinase)
MPDTLSLTVRNDRSEIPRLARIVAEFCDRHGLTALEGDLNLTLEEVVTNVMRHGYLDQNPHDIAVTLRLDPGQLTVRVEDDGRPFNPLEVPPPNLTAPLEERQAGGLGIFLVRELMDALEYHRQGDKNVLVMRKQTGERP